MPQTLEQQLAELRRLTTGELCDRYAQLFGQPVRTRHKAYLVRKLAWRIQALAEGDLSERAPRWAEELAHDADVRLTAPRPRIAPNGSHHAPRVATVADVVMVHLARPPLLDRQARRGAVQGLDLALLVAAEHDRVLGRIEVEAHHVPELVGEVRVVGGLEAREPVGLEAVGLPTRSTVEPLTPTRLAVRALDQCVA